MLAVTLVCIPDISPFLSTLMHMCSSLQSQYLTRVTRCDAQAIDHDSAGILKGALMYQTKKVEEVMTPLEKCFMLCEDTPLDFKVISQVFHLGHSRIPVYSSKASSKPPSDPNDIVGLLFTKDLILLDPEDATLVKNVVNFFSRAIYKVSWGTRQRCLLYL